MNRRTFIATTSIAAIGLPVGYYIKKRISKGNPLTTTELLSHFCDDREIREIGLAYRSLVPAENEKQKLSDLILTDGGDKKLSTSDWSGIEDLVAKKVHEDFVSSRILIVKGWVISATEARQCALYSLT